MANLIHIGRDYRLSSLRETAKREAAVTGKPQAIVNLSRVKSKPDFQMRPWRLGIETAHEGFLLEVIKPSAN